MSSPFDGLVSTFGAQATLYASDGVSNVRQTRAAISNARYTPMIGTQRGNVLVCYVPTGTALAAGDLLQIQAPERWYIIAKTLDANLPPIMGGLVTPGQSSALMAIPSILTRTRVAESAGALVDTYALNGYDEPRTGDAAGSVEVGTTATLRYGISNETQLLSEVVVGRLPQGVLTIYTPLGSDVQIGDQVTLDDGTFAVVSQRDPLAADGRTWALQLLLTASGGEGTLPSP